VSAVIFYSTRLEEAARTSEQLARKALSLDPSDAAALNGAGDHEGMHLGM
jgi:hypothetical protein